MSMKTGQRGGEIGAELWGEGEDLELRRSAGVLDDYPEVEGAEVRKVLWWPV